MRRFILALILNLCLAACAKESVQTSGTLIVLNKSGASASLISLDSNEAVATVQTGVGPHEAAVSPDGQLAVVTNYGTGQEAGSTLTVVDLNLQQATKTIDLGDYQRPHGIVFLEDGKRLLVTVEAQKALLVVDLVEGRIEQKIETAQNTSHMVALVPGRNLAFVANIRSGNVSVIDLEKGAAIQHIETGAGAEGIDISPDGRKVWVSNRAADSISIIDTESLEVIEELESKSFPIRVKFTPDGKHALVSNARSGDVAVFDAQTRTEVGRINMDLEPVEGKETRLFSDRFGESPVPVGILIHPDGQRAYVANTNADIVTVIDLGTWTITGRLQTGKEPDGLAWTPLQARNLTAK